MRARALMRRLGVILWYRFREPSIRPDLRL